MMGRYCAPNQQLNIRKYVMAKMKDLIIEVVEMYQDRMPLVEIARYMDMGIDEVIAIVDMYGEM